MRRPPSRILTGPEGALEGVTDKLVVVNAPLYGPLVLAETPAAPAPANCPFEPLLPEQALVDAYIADQFTVYSDGVRLKASALSTFVVSGGDMTGIEITVITNQGTEVLYWTQSSATSGGVSGTGWQLTQSGDTFTNQWRFEVSSPGLTISYLLINAAVANILFDTGRSPKAANSELGKSAIILLSDTENAAIRYSHKVDIGAGGNEDQFACLAIKLDPPLEVLDFDGELYPGELRFVADTDRLDEGVEFECWP